MMNTHRESVGKQGLKITLSRNRDVAEGSSTVWPR